ncbi:MAG: glycosyltransferase family 4 protein [Alphaproteobacteria bacterium]|nr:glycosyltransferase family 4 protein [Alphaproteobacteria bacterium]
MKPRLLDISRLISREGLGPHTGIDRVELAYFREFLRGDAPVYFLCRLPKSYVVLDRTGGQKTFDRIIGEANWSTRGLARIILPKSNPAHQAAVSGVWRLAIAKSSGRGLRKALVALFGNGVSYFNVGHSNIRQEVFDAVDAVRISGITVLIHDLIPLTYSSFSTPESTEKFTNLLKLTSELATRVIYNSKATQREAEAEFAKLGRVPPGVAAHLGVDLVSIPNIGEGTGEKPAFVVLGTIEPRKNHLLLLEIWQRFAKTLSPQDIPELHIIGRRGWNNGKVFSILDGDPMMGAQVFEHSNLPDEAVQTRLAQCRALLFPSFVEGFGLPLIEAASLGVPIICGENDIYREILGDYPLYLNVDNSYLWEKEILERAGRNRESEAERQARAGSVKIPTWDEHFDRIFRFV